MRKAWKKDSIVFKTWKSIIFLLALFSHSVFAEFSFPLLLDSNVFRCEDDLQFLNRLTPSDVERLYCSYKVAIKNFNNDNHSPWYISFSSPENLEGHLTAKLRHCKEYESKALAILEGDFPDYPIDCGKYHNFNRIMNSP